MSPVSYKIYYVNLRDILTPHSGSDKHIEHTSTEQGGTPGRRGHIGAVGAVIAGLEREGGGTGLQPFDIYIYLLSEVKK